MDPFTTFLLYAAFFILGELIRPKPKVDQAKPAGLGDFSFPTATEGRVVPIVWGTNKITGPNVVWYGDLRQDPITKHVKTGLFSSQDIVTGYKYKLGVQFAICRGTLDAVLRTWVGDDEVFNGTVTDGGTFTINKPDLFGGDELGNGGVTGTLKLFAGTESQLPSPYLGGTSVAGATVGTAGTGYLVGDILLVSGGTFTEAARFEVTSTGALGAVTGVALTTGGHYTVKPTNPVSTSAVTGSGTGCTLNLSFNVAFQEQGGDVPAYRGTAYLVPEAQPIYFGNSTSIKPWAFEVKRIPTGPATGPNQSVNGGKDANLVNVAYEIMTNTDWGLGIPTSQINTANWATAGATLASEGNGLSMVLDSPREASDLLDEIEQQMSGVIFFNQTSGLWEINLARGGYDVNTLPEITPSNRAELKSFTRGAWEDTTNQVRIRFFDRGDDYKETYAFAVDMANVRLQNGVNVSTEMSYAGVKDRTLANSIAWRVLRGVSYPLAKASVAMDRSYYATQPGSLVAFTDTTLGLTKLPMRVTKVDLGELEDNRVVLDLVQDIFTYSVGSFGDPPPSGWEPPSDSLVPFPAGQQLAFEAPRGFITRDPGSTGIQDRVWCGARKVGPEVVFDVLERHASGATSGPYADAGTGTQFVLIGVLQSSLGAGTAYPTSSLTVVPSPDSQSAIETAFTDGLTPVEIGTDLVNLCMVDNEMLLVSSSQTSGGNVLLQNYYRGVLDSVQAAHSAGAKVYLLFAGGTMTETVFTPTHNVDIKLVPRTATTALSESLATPISLTMANRVRRPYPPSSVSLNSVFFGTSASLEGTGSGESLGILTALNRRDLRTVDEVQALTADAASIFTDYPTVNGTTHEVDVRNDPLGTNVLLFTQTLSGASATIRRLDILKATDGVLPTTLRYAIRAKHTYEGTLFASRYDLVWDFSVSTTLTGQFNFGALAAAEVSNLYTATVNGTYSFTLSSAFTAGTVEYRKNGGAWTSLITAGSTTGNIAGIVATDTIEVRHSSTDTGAIKFLAMDAPGAGQDGYAIPFV